MAAHTTLAVARGVARRPLERLEGDRLGRSELVLFGAAASVLSFYLYAVVHLLPLHPALLPLSARGMALGVFLMCALDVLAVDLGVLYLYRRQRAREPQGEVEILALGLPTMTGLRSLPRGVVVTTLAVSGGLIGGSVLLGLPLWALAVLVLLPWLPLYCCEARWKYERFGLYALFEALVLLQLGHLGEHLVQNLQLVMTGGNVALAHGVFGQLDVETVHFLWDTAIWVGTSLLLLRFGRGNPWLWASWLIASVHGVEHLYMYWFFLFDHATYLTGGANGIMSQGGLVGSPLARPYMHLLYNFMVVGTSLLAFRAQTWRVFRFRVLG